MSDHAPAAGYSECMFAVTLGPLSFPLPPVLLLVSLGLAAMLARWLTAAEGKSASENSIWLAALLGLVAARVAHVLRHTDAYATAPWSALDVRDGGWLFGPGLAVAVVVLLWRCDRLPQARRALVSAAGAGLAVWAALNAAVQWATPAGDVHALPTVDLRWLDPGHQAAAAEPQSLAGLLDGRPLVVNLWASWCGPCRAEMPVLAQAQQQRPDVRFVFVNQGEQAVQVQRYLSAERLALKDVWLDLSSTLGPALGSSGLPTTVFFDAQGRRVDAHMGIINAASLQARLARWPSRAALP